MTKAFLVPISAKSAGAAATGRWVGNTATGAPTSGTYAVGDYVNAQDGVTWTCYSAGTPGLWRANTGPQVVQSANATANKLTSNVDASPPGSPVAGDLWMVTDVSPLFTVFSIGQLMAMGL